MFAIKYLYEVKSTAHKMLVLCLYLESISDNDFFDRLNFVL